MDLRRTGVLVLLLSMVPSAEAVLGLYDPKLCYILDGFLLFYGVLITALFVRERCFKPKDRPQEESVYTDLHKRHDGEYGRLNRRGDAETGAAHGGRRRTDDEGTYQSLQKGTEDTYREIPAKKNQRRHRNEEVYQGLSSATKDTYDKLHMQPLRPPR